MQSFKKYMDEAVEIRHDRYMRSHGKKASGGHGMWMFTHKDRGDVDHNNEKEVHTASGKFSDAAKSAKAWAKKHGHSTAYVMESSQELDEKLKASDDMGTWVKDFQDSDAPQFKGKSKEKKRQMAVAAKLSAERNESWGDKMPKSERPGWVKDPKTGKWVKPTQVKKEEVELDEVLDTPKAMDNYKAKATYSKDRAANSAAAKMLRNKNGFHSTDTSNELKTMDKRTKGLKMADKNAMKKTFKALRKEEVELDEAASYKATSEKSQFGGHRPHLKNPEGKTSYLSGTAYKTAKHAKGEAQAYHDAYFGGPGKANERGADRAVQAYRAKHKEHLYKKESLDPQSQFDLVESYLLENNIDVDSLSVEQLDEIIGKVIGGAFKVGAKAAVGAAGAVKKAANRMTTAGRADAAEKRADAQEKKNRDRERIKKAQERLRAAQAAARS